MSNELYLKLIEKAKAYIPSGASFTGDLSERVRELYALVGDDLAKGIISMHPGDYIRGSSEGDAGISLAAPIGYDIWYLFSTESVLPFKTEEDEERTAQILERLDPFLLKLQNIKPLKSLRSVDDLNFFTYWHWPTSKDYWQNNAPYIIKEMRYENVLYDKGFKYYSSGMPTGSLGFLAFPVGQLGVMEIVSLIGESITEDDSFKIDDQEAIVEGNEMIAPVHHNRGFCVGTHLIENGYLVQNDNIELMSEDFEEQKSVKPHRWLRYWLKSEDTFPVPGEFVALLAKSELFHVWWFQASYPFLYSGNWFETEYFTSGIVQEIIAPGGDELANVYRVWIRGYEMYLRSSDFYVFEIGERVTVIKRVETEIGMVGELTDNFDWTKLDDGKNNDSSSADSPDEDWCIVPLSFYKEAEHG